MELRAHRVEVAHGGRRSLADVSAAFTLGTRALVLGRAGAGKTLLLKALAGLVPPSAGEVRWDGEDVAALTAARRRERQAAFGMVFQTDALFDSLSVLDNVLLPLRNRGVPESQALARGREVLQAVGLAHAADTLPELPFARWLLLREGALVHDGAPAPAQLEALEAAP